MNREQHEQIVDGHIENALHAMFPLGEGRATRTQAEHHLRQVAQYAFEQGRSYALLSLLTVDQVLEAVNARLTAAGQDPISLRRMRAIIRNRHQRFGLGMQVGSTNVWLVTEGELDSLMPDERYR